MDTTQCIENKIWELYSTKRLSELELEILHAHVLGCDMCLDIKEGIDAMEDPTTLKSRIEMLDQKVDDRTQPSKQTFSSFWFAVAAAVFLFAIGLSWILFNNKETEVVIKTIENALPVDTIHGENTLTTTKEKETIKKTPPVIGMEKSPSGPPQIEEVLQERVIEQFEDTKSDAIVEPRQEPEKNTVVTATESEANISDDSKDSPTESTVQKTPTWAFGDGESKEKSNRNLITRKKSIKSTSSIKRLPAPANNSNTMKDDLDGLMVLTSDSVVYAKALQFYQSNNYDSCMLILNRLSTNIQSSYFEASYLLKAKTFIKKDQPENARIILQYLIQQNGKLAAEAKKLLEGLK